MLDNPRGSVIAQDMADIIQFSRGDVVFYRADPFATAGVVLAIVDYGSDFYRYLVSWASGEMINDSVELTKERPLVEYDDSSEETW